MDSQRGGELVGSRSTMKLVSGATLCAGLVWLVLAGAAAKTYYPTENIGALRCRACHKKAYEVWAGSAHAGAFKSLGSRKADSSCRSCHTLGTARHLQGVQCESCHGGGRYYAMRVVMVDKKLARAAGLRVPRGAGFCKRCHDGTGPRLRRFDYKKMWRKIAHGKKRSR